MHRIEKFEEEIFIENGLLTRLVYGIWKGNKVAIYKEDDGDNHYCKNCDVVFMNGWMMSIPGETYRQYGYTYTVKEEEWWSIREPLGWSEWERREALKAEFAKLAVELYPDFKYVLKKWEPVTTSQMMEALIIWKEHPDVEFLLAMKFENLAFSPAFMRLSQKKKKLYCKWIRENPDKCNINYKSLQTIINHNLTWEEWGLYQRFLNDANWYGRIHITYQVYKYLSAQINKLPNNWTPYEIVREWDDYKVMAIKAGHNLKEDYWKYPSNLVTAHDKCMKEVERMEEARRIAKAKAEAEEMRKNNARLRAIAKKFKDVPELIDGYSIFISTDYDEWEKQAKVLHQCICAGGYFQRVLNGECTLIFIQKDGVPMATAQIMSNGKLNQFYADEWSGTPGGSLPSEEIKSLFNKWLGMVPKQKFKTRRKKITAEAA